MAANQKIEDIIPVEDFLYYNPHLAVPEDFIFDNSPIKKISLKSVQNDSLEELLRHTASVNINWIHGTTSATLALMFKRPTLRSLVPLGILRKTYNLVPLAGELGVGFCSFFGGGRRRFALNYSAISGMQPTEEGFNTVINYACAFVTSLALEKQKIAEILIKINQLLDETIDHERSLVTIRSLLKKLDLYLRRYFQLSGITEQNGPSLYELFLPSDNKHFTIEDSFIWKLLKKISIVENKDLQKICIKYFSRFIMMFLHPEINPVELTEKQYQLFLSLINNPFPIIVAAKNVDVKALSRGVPGEHIVEGALQLGHEITEIFVLSENQSSVTEALKELNISGVAIKTFSCESQQANLYEENEHASPASDSVPRCDYTK